MLDILVAILTTGLVLVLLLQVGRGPVPGRTLARLSGNSKLISGYLRAARAVMAGSIALVIPVGFLLVLFITSSPGITLWVVWASAALIPGGYLSSRRLSQVALAAQKVSASGQLKAK